MMTEDGTNGEGLANFVGPVLRVGDLADAVVRAIEEDNPGKHVTRIAVTMFAFIRNRGVG